MRLLLAEDEEDLSRALVTVLKHNNYSVDAVYDGAEALDYLENGDNYDGVILDIMMPKMDGLTVLRTIRKHGNSVPVLLLTAKAEIDDRVEGLDSGADDYLPKPFSMKELLARIRAMTRRQSETTESILKFGDLALNRATYQLMGPENAAGNGIRLASKEYQMLEMLMTNPGQIISPDQFMDKIWGYDTEAEQNVVWVYISYLRKKLAAVGSAVHIKATRGIGYSLERDNAQKNKKKIHRGCDALCLSCAFRDRWNNQHCKLCHYKPGIGSKASANRRQRWYISGYDAGEAG